MKSFHFQGIVFDLDDTLYPQESFKRSGFRVVSEWVSAHCGYDPSEIRAILERIMKEKSPSYPYMFNDLAACLDMEARLVQNMVQVFIGHEPTIECYPGVCAMLTRLRGDFRIGILTDGRVAVQQRKIRALGLEDSADAILCSDSMGLEKPDPALFEWFEKKFDLSGADLVYVGDNPAKDFIGATKRNWGTIRVRTGEHAEKDALPGYDAAMILSSVFEVELTARNIHSTIRSSAFRRCQTA